MQENVSAIRVVKAYVREEFEGEKFSKASENVAHLLMRAELILAWNAPLMQLTVYSCILLISWIGRQLIVSSGATAFTTGDLMSMLSYCMNILMSLMMLSMVFVMITMSAASASAWPRCWTSSPTSRTVRAPLWRSGRLRQVRSRQLCL